MAGGGEGSLKQEECRWSLEMLFFQTGHCSPYFLCSKKELTVSIYVVNLHVIFPFPISIFFKIEQYVDLSLHTYPYLLTDYKIWWSDLGRFFYTI